VLEVCYHVIAILSCRAGGPTTASYARRISAAGRIQDLLSDGKHLQVPPLPLIPYAVGLTLTVTYRGLRDNAFEDIERAQADLATRCEMLEALSTYWWTADAMARLGRKALKSLKETGVRKASVANIANAMDAEISPCKHGPFDARHNHRHQTVNSAPTAVHARPPTSTSGTTGNGLQVLSDAAAAHSNSTIPKQSTHNRRSSSTATSTPTLTNTPSSSTATLSTKPSATVQTPQHLMNSYASGYSHVPPSSAAIINQSLNMNINANRPSRFSAPGTFFGNHNMTTNANHNLMSTTASTLTPFTAFDPSVQLYDPAFDDLDNLFEGFFDLSMPTIWQDPLFDGDAFSSADLDLVMGNNEPGIEAGLENALAALAADGSSGTAGPMTGVQMGAGGGDATYPEIMMQ
jgi:hypothetical protein